MEHVGIRELHLKTGDWVRRVARGEGVVVTERGRPVTSLIPFRQDGMGTHFGERRLLPEFEALPEIAGDTTVEISEDRDR